MKSPLALLVVAALVSAAEPPLVYRFDEVRRNVTVVRDGQARKVTAGDDAAAGDLVRTGWFAHTLLSVPGRASRFEIFPATTARLAHGEPGVLLVLERGRIKAIFDVFTGNDERIVRTPGGLLAVRGTRYGVEVDRGGIGRIHVFEGVVELRPFAPEFAPLRIQRGEVCEFGPGIRPVARPAPPRYDERAWSRGASSGRDGANPPGTGRDGGRRPDSGQPSSSPTRGRRGE